MERRCFRTGITDTTSLRKRWHFHADPKVSNHILVISRYEKNIVEITNERTKNVTGKNFLERLEYRKPKRKKQVGKKFNYNNMSKLDVKAIEEDDLAGSITLWLAWKTPAVQGSLV
jgi:hypothetical protein